MAAFAGITVVLGFAVVVTWNRSLRKMVAARTSDLYRELGERKRAEAALRASERKFRLLAENAQDLIYRMSLPDARYEYISPACLTLSGYPPDIFYENPAFLRSIMHPYWTEFFDQELKKLSKGEVEPSYEYQIIHKSGQTRWVNQRNSIIRDDTGQPVAIEGIVTDITDRKRAEEALELLRFSVNHMSEMVFSADGQGQFIFVNDAAARTLGHSREELLRMNVADVALAFIHTDWSEHWNRMRAVKSVHFESALTAKSGREITVEMALNYVEYLGKEYVFAFARDISDKKAAEEERHNLETQVQHAQKLESLGVLAGGIAHDFNNLLTGILGNSALLLEDLPRRSKFRPYVEDVLAASRRAAELCQQMLAYSGKGRFTIQRTDLTEVVREMAHLLRVSITKKATLKYDLMDNLPPIPADSTQLRQVVMNLITNASDAIDGKGGSIRISTGAMECSREYLHQMQVGAQNPEGPYVYVEVEDTGCGMSPDTVSRVFEPFFTTKFTGRGLGMAAVLGIVRGHSGSVKIASTPGEGTTFRVLFPVLEEYSIAETDKGCHMNDSSWSASGKALIVDDEDRVRRTVGRMLVRRGLEIVSARDGAEAVELFSENPEMFALVMLDLTMPRMDGQETIRELRRISPAVRVILISGYSEQEVAERLGGMRPSGFIQKPFDVDTFDVELKRVLGEIVSG